MAFRPLSRIVTVASPVGVVVPLADMREHLRIDPNDTSEDDVVAAVEAAAVRAVEKATQRLLIARQVTLRLPSMPGGRIPIELPGGVVSAVASVQVDGEAVAGAEALGDSPAVLVPSSDWPVPVGEGYPVEIVYTAGFASVPGDLVAAVKLWAGALFESREGIVIGTTSSEVQLAVSALIAPHRIMPA